MQKWIASLAMLLLLLGSFQAARAQYSYAAHTADSWFGIRGGVNLAGGSLDSELQATSNGLHTGILAGVQFDHWFGDMWAVGVQLLYDQKGAHEEYATGSVIHPDLSGTEDFTFNYLEIPVLLKIAFSSTSVKPYAFAGPSIGILMSATDKQALTTSTGSIDYKPYLKSTDVSLYFGVGLLDELYNGPMLFLDAGYAAGLTTIYNSTPPNRETLIDNSSAKSGDIRIAAGVMWKL